jgi:hypothetical protein
MNSKLKQIIFKKLYKDLSNVEIIFHTDESIWFINREEKYWYLEFEKSGKLWWRYEFFTNFFALFSMKRSEYEPIITEWVEDVLNRKVVSSLRVCLKVYTWVEDVLNRKVVSSVSDIKWNDLLVEDVLNRKVVSSIDTLLVFGHKVEDVLNREVVSSPLQFVQQFGKVEDVLNREVVSSVRNQMMISYLVEDVLNREVVSSVPFSKVKANRWKMS